MHMMLTRSALFQQISVHHLYAGPSRGWGRG